MKTKTGRVYAYHSNGNRLAKEIVRVIRGDSYGCMYRRTKGPRPYDIPYNFAIPEHFHRATREEIQQFLEQMPIK